MDRVSVGKTLKVKCKTKGISLKDKKLTLPERLDNIEKFLFGSVSHTLVLHTWLLGLILGVGSALLVALIVKFLVG